MNAASVICSACESQASLNIAATGSIFSGLPFTHSNPAGLFIQALAETTKMPDITPEIPTAGREAKAMNRKPRPAIVVSTFSAPPTSWQRGSTLSGAPSATGTYNFTARAQDSSTGTGPYAGTRAYALVVAPPCL